MPGGWRIRRKQERRICTSGRTRTARRSTGWCGARGSRRKSCRMMRLPGGGGDVGLLIMSGRYANVLGRGTITMADDENSPKAGLADGDPGEAAAFADVGTNVAITVDG